MKTAEFDLYLKQAIDADLAIAQFKNEPFSWQKGNEEALQALEWEKFYALYPLLLARKTDRSLPLLVTLNTGISGKHRLPEEIHPFSLTTGDICVENPSQSGEPYYIRFSLDWLRLDEPVDELPELPNSLDTFQFFINRNTVNKRLVTPDSYFFRSVDEMRTVRAIEKEETDTIKTERGHDRTYLNWVLGTKHKLIERFLSLKEEESFKESIILQDEESEHKRATMEIRYRRSSLYVTIPLSPSPYHRNTTAKFKMLIEKSGGYDISTTG